MKRLFIVNAKFYFWDKASDIGLHNHASLVTRSTNATTLDLSASEKATACTISCPFGRKWTRFIQ
jgi:hypothetical protein